MFYMFMLYFQLKYNYRTCILWQLRGTVSDNMVRNSKTVNLQQFVFDPHPPSLQTCEHCK